MDQLNRLTRPIITGTPSVQQDQSPRVPAAGQQGTTPFLSVLQQKLEAGSNTAFSKHAVSRVAQRQADVSEENLARLSQGVSLARQKGLRDALILIDQDAYIVDTAKSTVVTVSTEAAKGSVFTNIDGTVIV